jgi:hypothetical protein
MAISNLNTLRFGSRIESFRIQGFCVVRFPFGMAVPIAAPPVPPLGLALGVPAGTVLTLWPPLVPPLPIPKAPKFSLCSVSDLKRISVRGHRELEGPVVGTHPFKPIAILIISK